jgi:hypothetical protein
MAIDLLFLDSRYVKSAFCPPRVRAYRVAQVSAPEGTGHPSIGVQRTPAMSLATVSDARSHKRTDQGQARLRAELEQLLPAVRAEVAGEFDRI